MKIHMSARLTPWRREEMALAVTNGQMYLAQAAHLDGVLPKTFSRLTAWFKTAGRRHGDPVVAENRSPADRQRSGRTHCRFFAGNA